MSYAVQTTIDPNLNLEKILDEFFLILTPKEQTVVTKRFALDAKPKQTLEKIGQHFSVTRERVRQIENIALQKLRRNIGNTQLQKINLLAREILAAHGGVMKEEALLAEILNFAHFSQKPVTGSIIKLSLTIDPELDKLDTSKVYFPFWRQKAVALSTIEKVASANHKVLKKEGEVTLEKELFDKVQKFLKEDVSPVLLLSALQIDRRFRKVEKDKWGLMEWRDVNPRSIRDKANIILKKSGNPLHFIEISNQIGEIGIGKKKGVTTQAVHNELIRHAEFVLVGRGMYALREWGYKPGTVSDVIYDILKENGPLKKKEIVQKVLDQRNVKLGTISLNLQKNPAFVRVGRAVYDLEESKFVRPERGRGRAKM